MQLKVNVSCKIKQKVSSNIVECSETPQWFACHPLRCPLVVIFKHTAHSIYILKAASFLSDHHLDAHFDQTTSLGKKSAAVSSKLWAERSLESGSNQLENHIWFDFTANTQHRQRAVSFTKRDGQRLNFFIVLN